jgi:arylsulfatase A-like enzyme
MTGRRPNFILILCDDLGYGDIEPYGGVIPTPAIARMAAEGLLATDFYAPANLCSPSRAGFLTGRYPIRAGLAFEVILQGDDRVFPMTERTIAHALKPDYASGLFGKWHLGHRGPDWLPTKHGFDTFFGIPYSHDMLPLELFEADATVEQVTSAEVDFSELQQAFYTHARRFIEKHRARPFFVQLSLSAPHLPEYPNAAFKGVSKAGAYGDVVLEIDSIVGRLIELLWELGVARDTCVFFTSDNGPWFEGSANPLRYGKGSTAYDGGYRVPFVAWAPGLIPAGSNTGAIISGLDLLPTFCSLAGVAPPAGIELDGRDISGVLTSGARSPLDELLLFNNEEIVGIRTQRWKYVTHAYYRSLLFDLERAGYPGLFDMSVDVTESYSVAANFPDETQEMQARVRRAREKFAPYKKGMPPFLRELIRTGAFRPQD